jgi:N4-gp56 family major capsid protein
MATTGSVQLSAEVQALYDADYYMTGQSMVYFDQLYNLRKQMNGERGNSYQFPIIESNQPQTGTLSEYDDVVSQQMRANSVSVTLAEYGGAIDLTRFVTLVSYSEPLEQAAQVNGYTMAESIDLISRAVAGQGGRQFFINARTARSGLQGVQTAADRLNPAFIELLAILARNIRMPLYEDGSVCAIIHAFPFYDLLQNTGIRDMATRQTPEMLFNGELAYWGGMRLIVSANAKGFWGEGAAATTSVSTTLAAAAAVGDSNLKYAAGTPVVGDWYAIRDAGESGNTWSDTNELFRVTAAGTSGAGGTGIDGFALDPGPGDAGGVRYAHASGTAIRNHNPVFPIIVVGPNSLTKAASSFTGPYGVTVTSGPFDKLGRFFTFGWYLVAGYARTRTGWIMRGEVSSSQGGAVA